MSLFCKKHCAFLFLLLTLSATFVVLTTQYTYAAAAADPPEIAAVRGILEALDDNDLDEASNLVDGIYQNHKNYAKKQLGKEEKVKSGLKGKKIAELKGILQTIIRISEGRQLSEGPTQLPDPVAAAIAEAQIAARKSKAGTKETLLDRSVVRKQDARSLEEIMNDAQRPRDPIPNAQPVALEKGTSEATMKNGWQILRDIIKAEQEEGERKEKPSEGSRAIEQEKSLLHNFFREIFPQILSHLRASKEKIMAENRLPSVDYEKLFKAGVIYILNDTYENNITLLKLCENISSYGGPLGELLPENLQLKKLQGPHYEAQQLQVLEGRQWRTDLKLENCPGCTITWPQEEHALINRAVQEGEAVLANRNRKNFALLRIGIVKRARNGATVYFDRRIPSIYTSGIHSKEVRENETLEKYTRQLGSDSSYVFLDSFNRALYTDKKAKQKKIASDAELVEYLVPGIVSQDIFNRFGKPRVFEDLRDSEQAGVRAIFETGKEAVQHGYRKEDALPSPILKLIEPIQKVIDFLITTSNDLNEEEPVAFVVNFLSQRSTCSLGARAGREEADARWGCTETLTDNRIQQELSQAITAQAQRKKPGLEVLGCVFTVTANEIDEREDNPLEREGQRVLWNESIPNPLFIGAPNSPNGVLYHRIP